MRFRTFAALAAVGISAAVVASGFPRRIGLTASQAAVSLPGDLLLPDAQVVVDRGVSIDAPAERVWDVLIHAFEPDDDSTLIEVADEDYLLMHVTAPLAPEGAQADGTCVIALLPISPSRTLLHIRERHVVSDRAQSALIWAGVTAESLSSFQMLRDLRDACVNAVALDHSQG